MHACIEQQTYMHAYSEQQHTYMHAYTHLRVWRADTAALGAAYIHA
jgi:hypothetical protein